MIEISNDSYIENYYYTPGNPPLNPPGVLYTRFYLQKSNE